MREIICDKITGQIRELETLQKSVDFSFWNMAPDVGLKAKDRVEKIIDDFLFIRKIGSTTRHYFTELLGSESEFRKRIIRYRTTGKTAGMYSRELADIGPEKSIVGPMLRDTDYGIYPKDCNFLIVRFRISEVFKDQKTHSFHDLLKRAPEIGLFRLPHEVAPDFALKNKISIQDGKSLIVFSVPIHDTESKMCIFKILNRGGELVLGKVSMDSFFPFEPESEFLFTII